MLFRVHLCLFVLIIAGAAQAMDSPPPGLVSWGSETYTLDSGESVMFRVDFDQIPVRRWLLLVEGDMRRSYLNLRRTMNGSLVYDMRGESRHEISIPWGVGETVSGVLTATHEAGAFSVSIWGPPRDNYLRAYGYEVNRALEAIADDDRNKAQRHLAAALHDDPQDAVAKVLMHSLAQGGHFSSSTAGGTVVAVQVDSLALMQVEESRERASLLRQEGQFYAAADTLQRCLEKFVGVEVKASIFAELTRIYLDLGNFAQAESALQAAMALGYPEDEAAALQEELERRK